MDDSNERGAVIRTRDLTKVYRGELTAVDGLDLEVHRGEVFGLLGPNGAGKTTTVGLLTTRVVPTRGSALVAGVDVIADPARARRAIGVVSQVNTLSGGMARRLMVARAALHRPAVLFLDEPTAGLDPQSRLVLWDLVGELRSEGHTVLLTTHFMEEADRLCDRVAIMDRGRVLALDAPAALKRSLGGEVEMRVGVRGDADGFAEELRDRLGELVTGPPSATAKGVRIRLRESSRRAVAAAVAAASERAVALTDLAVAEPTLETVFLNLTGRELRE